MMPAPCALPAELTIYVAAELRPQWLPWLADAGDGQPVEVDARAVAEVDAAGLQLLASLAVSLHAQGRELRLVKPSRALRKGCAELGMADLLPAEESAP